MRFRNAMALQRRFPVMNHKTDHQTANDGNQDDP